MVKYFELLLKNPHKFFRLIREHVNPRGKLQPIKRPEFHWRFSMNLAQWIIRHQKEILTTQVTWMGIPVWKNVLDLFIYQEIIFKQKPDFIVEIGSAEGGSTLYLAQLCDLLNHGEVLSVDLDHRQFKVDHPRIIKITGQSTDPKVIQKVHVIAQGKNTLIIQDADHSKEVVLADLNNYSDLVPVRGYFIVEDTIMDVFNPGNGVGRSIDGPLCAVEQFLRENKNFVVDESLERYIITQNPHGYLKRMR